MCMNASASDLLHIIDRRAKTNRLHDRRRSSLETMRRLIIGDVIARDLIDHFAAAKERRKFLQPFLLGIKRANARRTVELMAGHNIEIDVEILDIDLQMDRPLRTIDQDRNTALMRDPDDVLHR